MTWSDALSVPLRRNRTSVASHLIEAENTALEKKDEKR